MRTLVYTTLFLFFHSFSFSQFGDRIYIDQALNGIRNLAAGDFNQDGLNDIAVVTTTSVAWIENTGTPSTPSYGSQNILSGDWINSFNLIKVEDMDADGFPDIIAASENDDVVLYFKNLGGGNFEEADLLTSTKNRPTKIDVGDINGDGDLDILVFFRYEEELVVFNNSNGNFGGPSVVVETGNLLIFDLLFFDGDEDGDQDIMHASNLGLLRYYYNNGSGSFPFPQTTFGVIGQYSSTVYQKTAAGDIDNDGDLDFISSFNNEDAPIGYIENLGAGNFGDETFSPLTDYVISNLNLLDLNGDGFLDMVGDLADTTLLWYPGQGTFDFMPPSIISNNLDLSYYDFADLNNDGLADILSSNGGTISVTLNEGNGVFGEQQTVYYGAIYNKESTLADIDGDGLNDILLASEWSDVLSWYKNMGNGNFSGQKVIAEITEVRHCTAADLDNDGDMDVISSTIFGSTGINIHENLGNGIFGPMIPLGGAGSFVFTEDIDGDGDQDIFVGSTLKCFLNQGGLNFASSVSLNTGFSTILQPIATDLDNDGDLDFAGGYVNANEVLWIENTGTLNFTLHEIDTDFDSPFNIFPTDLSGDGLPDLMVSSRDDENISIFVNNGNGTFQNRQIILSGIDYPRDAFTADIDFDGDQDIITSAPDDDAILFFGNLGNGTFAMPQFIDDDIYSFEAKASDLDQDGDLDIISVGIHGDIVWYENFTYNLGSNTVQGSVFLDSNENGVKDTEEVLLQNFPIELNPNGQENYSSNSNNNSTFLFALDNGTYTIAPQLEPCWALTTAPTQYDFTITENSPLVQNFDFGVTSVSNESKLNVSLIAASPTRCGFTVPYYLMVSNEGCTTLDGTYGFFPSEFATMVQSFPNPDNIINDTLFWNFEELNPTETAFIYLEFTVANVSAIGEIIEMPAMAYSEDNNGSLVLEDQYLHLSEITCAYDPNDKQVVPIRSLGGIYNENYTLFSEDLEYTVRFQNTGNDTAFTVVIRDQLSNDLDWDSFTPKTSSHEYKASITDDGLATFTFEDILLPDSTTNEIASHGFINFSIKAKQDLPNFTSIFNSVGIFFDFNPPIITNEIENIMVDPLPPIVEAAYSFEPDFLTVSFQDESLNNPISWVWDFGDGQTSTLQNPTHTYAQEGTYTVCLTVENNFTSDSICSQVQDIMTSNSTLNSEQNTYSIFPNPTNGATTIDFFFNISEEDEFTIMDQNGKRRAISYNLRDNRISLNTSTLGKGLWLFQLKNKETIVYGKFLVL